MFKVLREKGFLYKSDNTNIPYQRYINDGTFVVVKKVHNQNSFKKTYSQTLITSKGCQKIYSALRNFNFNEEPELGCIHQMLKDAQEYNERRLRSE